MGSKGIYFGGKDIIVSEASGPLSFCVLPPAESDAEKGGGAAAAGGGGREGPLPSRFALMEMRVGAGAAAAAQEWGASSSSSSSGSAAAAAAGAGALPSSSSPPRRGMVRPPSFSSSPSSSSPLRRSSPSRGAGASGAGSGAGAANKAPPPSRMPGAATAAAAAAATGAAATGAAASSRSSRPPLPPPSSSSASASLLVIPRTAEERAAAVAEASAGPQTGKAVAARFLAKIGSATAMERYARKAALPHGPREAWPGAEEEGAAAETRGASVASASGASSPPSEAAARKGLVGRLMRRAAARRASRKGERAAAARGSGSRAGGGSAAAPISPDASSSASASTAEVGDGAPVGALGVSRAASSSSLLGGSCSGGGAGARAAAGAALASSSSRAFLSDAQEDIEAAAAAEAAMPEEARGGGGGGGGEVEDEEGINLERLLSSSSDDDGGGGGERGKAAIPPLLPPPPPDGGHLGTASAPTDAGDFTASEIPRLALPEKKKNKDAATAASTANGGSTDGGGGDGTTSRGGREHPSSTQRPLRVVVRLCDVALVGEKGSRCPSLSVAELSLELELHGRLAVKYERGAGGCWAPAGRCAIDVSKVARSVRGASVPVPPALLKLIVSAVLPPVFQRLLLGALPAELGEYLLDAGVGVRLAGDLVALGPALPALDAPLSAATAAGAGGGAAPEAAGGEAARRAARRDGAAAEARAAVGLSAAQARVLDALFCDPRFSLVGVGPPPSAAAAAAPAHAGASEGGEAAPQQQQQRLRPNPPLTLGSLVRLRHRYARHPELWESTCALWDAAASALAAAWNLREKPPPLEGVSAAAASAIALKPLRASLALGHADAGCNVDAAVRCLRLYFERQARELAVVAGGGAGSSAAAAGAPASGGGGAGGRLPPPPPPPGLAAALGALEAWHAYTLSRLAGFKASFRGASARVVAQADARGLSLGAEGARYVGPLRLRLPVRLRQRGAPGAARPAEGEEEEAGWSFEIPLPDPGSYAVRRFVDACRSAMASSASLGRVAAQAAAAARARETRPGAAGGGRGSLPPPPPPPPTRAAVADPGEALGWFCVDDAERAAAGLPPLPPPSPPPGTHRAPSASSVPRPAPSCVPPTRLGTVSVDGARARVRLDEEAVAELLGAGGPSGGLGDAPAASAVRLARSAARVLAALGDVARLSFAPAAAPAAGAAGGGGGEGEGAEFVLVAESAAAASLHVDVAGVSFATAEGVTPARLVRLAHGVARSVLLAMLEGAEGGGEGGGRGGGGDAEEGDEEPEQQRQRRAQLAASLASLDAKFDLAHAHLGREALDAAVCLDATARVDRERLGGALVLRVRGLPPGGPPCPDADDASAAAQQPPPPPPPLLAVNDLELMTLFGARPPGPDDAEDEAMAA